MAEIK